MADVGGVGGASGGVGGGASGGVGGSGPGGGSGDASGGASGGVGGTAGGEASGRAGGGSDSANGQAGGGVSADGASAGLGGAAAAAGFDGAMESAQADTANDDGETGQNATTGGTNSTASTTSSPSATAPAANIDAAMMAAEVEDEAQPTNNTGLPTGMSVPGYAAGSAIEQTGKATLDANPQLSKDWGSYRSNVPHRSYSGPNVGFTEGVSTRLEAAGINQLPDERTPPGLVASSANKDQPARGAVARDLVADDYRAQGYDVRTEVTEATRHGDRRVDVVAEKPGVRIDTEVKLGRVDANSRVRSEIAKDAAMLAENRTMRAVGTTLDGLGKVAKPVGVVMDAVSLHQAYRADGNQIGDNTLNTASGVAGGTVGGGLGLWGGALAGAAVGGPVGAVVGGLLGAFGGSLLGDWGGRSAYGAVQ